MKPALVVGTTVLQGEAPQFPGLGRRARPDPWTPQSPFPLSVLSSWVEEGPWGGSGGGSLACIRTRGAWANGAFSPDPSPLTLGLLFKCLYD